MVLKIPMKMLNTINDALTYMWKKIADITDANKIHIIYESYFEKFLKGLEPLRRTPDVANRVYQTTKTIPCTCAT